MIRRSQNFFDSLMASAPVLVIPFLPEQKTGARARLVAREDVDQVTSGIITMSPIADFFHACKFAWMRLEDRAEMRRYLAANRSEVKPV